MWPFKKAQVFPIEVTLWTMYNNTITHDDDKGAYIQERLETEDGFIDRSYLVLKNKKIRIPAVDIEHYADLGKTRLLHLVELDIGTFFPVKYSKEGMFYWANVPVFDENGNPVKIIKDGKEVFKSEKKEIQLFGTNKVLNVNGEISATTQGVIVSNYDKEQWFTQEIESDMKLYKNKPWWEKWSWLIGQAIVFAFILIIFWLGMKYYTDISKTLALNMKNNVDMFQTSMQIFNQTMSKIANSTLLKPIMGSP
jgi:hypothetical protein